MAKQSTPSYPALILSQNNHRFYFSTIPVQDLFPYCFVARRQEDPRIGFQRALSEPRAEDISKYLSAGSGSIPTNVVLSAQPEANFSYNGRSKTISFSRATGSFLVLDGQHRLWGYELCPIKHRVPVAIYEGLKRAEETRLFIDINTNQRGVPAALLLDIKQLADMESSKESTLRFLFDRLHSDSKSALCGKLSPAKSAPNRISRVTFNRAVGGALSTAITLSLMPEDLYRLIRNFVNAFDAELPSNELLVRAGYFEAIFEMFDEILRATMQTHQAVRQDSIQETIRVIAKLDFSTKGNLTKRGYMDIMQAAFRQRVALSPEML